MIFTCYSCLHSIGSYPGAPLICTEEHAAGACDVTCEAFCFEPGTDEGERDAVVGPLEGWK